VSALEKIKTYIDIKTFCQSPGQFVAIICFSYLQQFPYYVSGLDRQGMRGQTAAHAITLD
jgi:hypothetical protein